MYRNNITVPWLLHWSPRTQLQHSGAFRYHVHLTQHPVHKYNWIGLVTAQHLSRTWYLHQLFHVWHAAYMLQDHCCIYTQWHTYTYVHTYIHNIEQSCLAYDYGWLYYCGCIPTHSQQCPTSITTTMSQTSLHFGHMPTSPSICQYALPQPSPMSQTSLLTFFGVHKNRYIPVHVNISNPIPNPCQNQSPNVSSFLRGTNS